MACYAKGMNPKNMTIENVIANGMETIFSFPYEFEIAERKLAFQQKLLRHYYFDEIGMETPALFRWALQDALEMIMPRYNQLMKSTLLQFDPISNFSYKEVFEGTENMNRDLTDNREVNGESDSSSDTHSLDKHSDTPQDVVSSIGSYLSSADESNAEGSAHGTTRNTSEQTQNETQNKGNNHTLTMTGFRGTDPNKLLQEYRKTLLNIERDIIEDREIRRCFMGVY